jgi:Cof subfamily protein (haloacid dehalogenase superfamily)
LAIKLLVLDIDGTIAGKSNRVNSRTIAAIGRLMARGIKVTLATGRMYESALFFQQQIGSQLPLIVYNGALIKDPLTGKVYRHNPVDAGVARELLDYLENPLWRDNLGVHFYLDDRLYVRKLTSRVENYATRSRIEAIAVGDLRQILDRDPTKILAIGDRAELITELLGKLPDYFPNNKLNFTQSTPTFLEATHPRANKGEAVRYLAEEILGFTSEEVMAIGDNFNDREMLEYAGVGVVMGNAPEALKRAIDRVTLDVDNDGVVAAIEQIQDI